jgi:heme-degrading monooxygenase HmoA
MAVLITAEVPGQTKEGYEGVLAAVGPLLRNAKGFIAHGAAQTADGCRCFEIWETQEDATQFFAKYIHPNLQEGIKPKRSILELHTLITI